MKTSREKCNRLTFERGLDTLVPAFLETLISSRHEAQKWIKGIEEISKMSRKSFKLLLSLENEQSEIRDAGLTGQKFSRSVDFLG